MLRVLAAVFVYAGIVLLMFSVSVEFLVPGICGVVLLVSGLMLGRSLAKERDNELPDEGRDEHPRP